MRSWPLLELSVGGVLFSYLFTSQFLLSVCMNMNFLYDLTVFKIFFKGTGASDLWPVLHCLFILIYTIVHAVVGHF
jgi:hypothetical protein